MAISNLKVKVTRMTPTSMRPTPAKPDKQVAIKTKGPRKCCGMPGGEGQHADTCNNHPNQIKANRKLRNAIRRDGRLPNGSRKELRWEDDGLVHGYISTGDGFCASATANSEIVCCHKLDKHYRDHLEADRLAK